MNGYDQERDNMIRWDQKRTSFFEEYTLKVNPLGAESALWLRYSLLAPKRGRGFPSAGVWAFYFRSQGEPPVICAKEICSIDQALIDQDIFFYQIKESAVYNNGARGELNSGNHRIAWDLEFIPNERTFKLLPLSFFLLPFPRAKMLAPNWSVRAKGFFEVDGRKISFKDQPASQAHQWGGKHLEKWGWSHCNSFSEDPLAAFEILTLQFPLGKKRRRPLTLMCLKLGSGRVIKFNRMVHWLFNKSQANLEEWTFQAQRGQWKLKGKIQARPQNFAGYTFTDPDGRKLYGYHTELAKISLELLKQKRGAYQPVSIFSSQQGASLEWVDRTPITDWPMLL